MSASVLSSSSCCPGRSKNKDRSSSSGSFPLVCSAQFVLSRSMIIVPLHSEGNCSDWGRPCDLVPWLRWILSCSVLPVSAYFGLGGCSSCPSSASSKMVSGFSSSSKYPRQGSSASAVRVAALSSIHPGRVSISSGDASLRCSGDAFTYPLKVIHTSLGGFVKITRKVHASAIPCSSSACRRPSSKTRLAVRPHR